MTDADVPAGTRDDAVAEGGFAVRWAAEPVEAAVLVGAAGVLVMPVGIDTVTDSALWVVACWVTVTVTRVRCGRDAQLRGG